MNLARRGFAVFPVVPRGKEPLTSHGLKDATGSETQIHMWWRRWPDANVAVATGSASNLAVLDIDGPEGEASLAEFDPLPPTPMVITGAGVHFWFRPTGVVRNSAGRIGKDLDVRGEGGYVVAPPSVHASGGRYSWASGRRELATWPDHLSAVKEDPARAMDHVPERPRMGDRYALAALELECDAVRHSNIGARNDTLNRAAFNVARFVGSGDLRGSDVAESLIAAAVDAGLPEHEARATIRSAFKGRRSG